MTDERSWRELLSAMEADRLHGGSAPTRRTDTWMEALARIRRYAAGLLSTRGQIRPEDVEDIAQEVMSKLQSPDLLGRLRRLRSPEGYLIATIKNAATDLARRIRSQRRSLARLGVVLSDPGETRPGEGVQDARLASLTEELRNLSPDEVLLLRMRFWRGLKIGDIAAHLDLPYSTVAVRLFRLLSRLRARLEQSPP